MNLMIPMSNVRRYSKLLFLVALTNLATLALSDTSARADTERAREAREATMALDVKRAHTLLDNVESTDEAIAIERAAPRDL